MTENRQSEETRLVRVVNDAIERIIFAEQALRRLGVVPMFVFQEAA